MLAPSQEMIVAGRRVSELSHAELVKTVEVLNDALKLSVAANERLRTLLVSQATSR